jgi:flagellar basal body-associated protein FliL
MKTEKQKFLLTLFLAFLLLLAVFFAYVWFVKKGTEKKKATVAVCGQPDKN